MLDLVLLVRWLSLNNPSSDFLFFYVCRLLIALGLGVVCPVLKIRVSHSRVAFCPMRLTAYLSFCLRLYSDAWISRVFKSLLSCIIKHKLSWLLLIILPVLMYFFEVLGPWAESLMTTNFLVLQDNRLTTVKLYWSVGVGVYYPLRQHLDMSGSML